MVHTLTVIPGGTGPGLDLASRAPGFRHRENVKGFCEVRRAEKDEASVVCTTVPLTPLLGLGRS